ncbi:hypothetical protein L3Q82_016127, partial [Scortum barcoo]
MAWALKLPLTDEVIESGLVQDFDASLSGIGQELGAGAYSMSDVLALPIFKQEESNLPPDTENKILPFQYVLCAATSPAVKLHDETLTYLNQGQSYEIRMLDNRKIGELPEITGKMVKSIIRVVFHDRRLQYTEHQQLEGWRWNRPGDRILDLDIPMSVGIIDPRANPTQLNTVEFLWDPSKRTSVFIQVHCISTEFTMRKHGGEKGVPFRIQIDTFKENENEEYTEHLHSASCQVKVFKPKGADRKQKTDREKMEKRAPQEKEKYQPSYETTILTECCPWPEVTYVNNSPSPGFNSTHNSFPVAEGNGSPNHQPEPVVQVVDNLLPTATPQDAQQWLLRNRFSPFCRLFTNFSGADLLKLTREDVIQICGPADGIRLFNALKGRVVRPRLTIYVCQESQQAREQQPKHENGDAAANTFFVYHAIYLEELTAAELTEKIAQLFNISPRQINQIFKQGPTGIHVLVSDEMIQNFQDEVCFVLDTMKDDTNDGYHIILKHRVSMEAGSSLSLKRRYEEVDNSSPFSTPKDSDDDISSSDSADSCDSLNPPSSTAFTPTSILRQHKPSPGGKRVRFDVVTVYYFPRRQGFTSVPSQGGSSLGMARHHSSIRHYTLGEFAREQETSHRHTLRQHLRQEKLNARKMKLTRNGTVECAQADLLTLEDVSDEDLDVDGVEVDDCFFLQPLPTKRRRALLRASGIARIDAREKAELRAIRLSREGGVWLRLPLVLRPSALRLQPGWYQVPVTGLDSELEESEVQTVVEVQDLLAEQDILERENETAVLHLQSAEEQERREREEAEGEAVQQELGAGGLTEQPLCLLPGALGGELPEQAEVPGVEQVLLQGPFPTGATVLCITDNQEESPSELLKDSTSLLYYQLSPIEPAAFETLPSAGEAEQEERLVGDAGGGECVERKQEGREESKVKKPEEITCRQSLTNVILCSEE